MKNKVHYYRPGDSFQSNLLYVLLCSPETNIGKVSIGNLTLPNEKRKKATCESCILLHWLNPENTRK